MQTHVHSNIANLLLSSSFSSSLLFSAEKTKSDTHAVKYTARLAHNTQTCHMLQHTNVATDGSRQGQIEGIIYTRISYSIYTEPSVGIYVRVVQYVHN